MKQILWYTPKKTILSCHKQPHRDCFEFKFALDMVNLKRKPYFLTDTTQSSLF